MSRLGAAPRHLAALLLPLLAAGLACSTTPISSPTPNARTQAAVTAIAATDAVAAVVDPCTLMSSTEATVLAGEQAQPPKPLAGGGCIYFDSAITTTGVGLYVLPAAHAQGFLGQYVPALMGNGVPLDQKLAVKLTDDSAAGDMPAAVNDLADLTRGIPGYDIQKLDGVGSAAFWSWHALDHNQEGVLMAAKPGALVAVILRSTPTTQEADVQPAVAAIVSRILASLPARFTVPGTP